MITEYKVSSSQSFSLFYLIFNLTAEAIYLGGQIYLVIMAFEMQSLFRKFDHIGQKNYLAEVLVVIAFLFFVTGDGVSD